LPFAIVSALLPVWRLKLVCVMSKIAAHIVTRSIEFFPIALVGIGLVATTLWAGSLMTIAFEGAWSILSAI
jgi:hypothetical protein